MSQELNAAWVLDKSRNKKNSFLSQHLDGLWNIVELKMLLRSFAKE